VLNEGTAPGAVLRCARAKKVPAGVASVMPAPVLVLARAWRQLDGKPLAPNTGEAVLPPTYTARLRMRLPPGRWSVSLPYRARFDTTARLDGRRVALPAFLGQKFSPLELGQVEGGREVVVEATGAYRSGGVANVASFVGPVTAARVDQPSRTVPLRRACGHYVDFFRAG
jgi:hypothetical protein